MKITLVSTVYNESGSIETLLESVIEQKRQPEEAIIVDGGSDDGTQEIVREYASEHGWIELVVDEGCNIAEGRNTGVENASHEHILVTDGGCRLDEEWVQKMAAAFNEGYEALAGLWKPESDNLFEFVQGEIRGHHVKPENVPEGWAPSSRSAGFTKEVWRDAGKYPEDLYTGEDSEFNARVREAGYQWHVVHDAFVYWDMRATWSDYFEQFYRYGEGEARSRTPYPDRIFGVSKTALRLATTVIAATGVAGLALTPLSIVLVMLGLAPQYGSKTGSLISCVSEKGVETVPYWLAMIPFESTAFTLGYLQGRI